ncbi:MAG: hypothetical protein V1897_05980 [Pseudomonadota bacterium]
MAEATQYTLSFKELAEIIVKKQGLHEGVWGIYVKFGLSAGSIGFKEQDILPTAMVPIIEIGIQKQGELSPLAVDAAVVNPRPVKKKKSSSK